MLRAMSCFNYYMPTPAQCSPEEINAALVHLPAWDVVERTPSGSKHSHIELHKQFQFSSFSDALHFMFTASRFINLTDHHPCWQNTYSKLEVWLTTGELKHKLSVKDLTLAQYLESLFQNYK